MNERQIKKERAPDRNLVMVIVIVLTSAFLVGYLLMGWVSGVQIDVWMWNLEDFLTEKRWNLLTGLAVIIILSSIFPIIIPKVIVFQAPGIAYTLTRIRGKFYFEDNIAVTRVGGSRYDRIEANRAFVRTRFGTVIYFPPPGSEWRLVNGALRLESAQWEMMENSRLLQELADARVWGAKWKRLALEVKQSKEVTDAANKADENNDGDTGKGR